MFVIALIPITHILRASKMGYQIEKTGPTINHTLFMDDLKLFGKSENEIDSLVKTVQQGLEVCSSQSEKREKSWGERYQVTNWGGNERARSWGLQIFRGT